MGLIQGALFKDVSDRLAKQAENVISGLDAAIAHGGGFHYERIHEGVPAVGDLNTEYDLINQANDLDVTDHGHNSILLKIYGDMINAHESHITSRGGYSNLDGYLTASGIRVSCLYGTAYYATKNKHLLAENVFGPAIDPMGTIVFTSSGVATFTDGDIVGTGSGDHDETVSAGYPHGKHASANLEVYVVSGIGSNDAILDITCKRPAGTTVSRQVTVTAGSPANTIFGVGTASTDFFIDVTNIRVAGGNPSQTVAVRSKLERTIAL